MMRDFNLPSVDWSTHSLEPDFSASSLDKETIKLTFDFMDEFSLTQLVCEPTGCQKYTLDIVFSNCTGIILKISGKNTTTLWSEILLPKDQIQWQLSSPSILHYGSS